MNNSNWETETFQLFDHCLTQETVMLDIGAWIGPTLLYAAGRTKLTLGFEPDPIAYQTLAKNIALNPQLNVVRIFPVAIAGQHGQATMGSRTQAGDSMSSLLFAGETERWTVELRRIEEFEQEWPAGAPLFVKIDIEGGEYQLIPHLGPFISRHRPTVYLSLHPWFFLLPYRGHDLRRRLRGEWALFWNTWRAWHTVYRQFSFIYDPAGGRLRARDLLRPQRWRHSGGLVLSHQAIGYLERPPIISPPAATP